MWLIAKCYFDRVERGWWEEKGRDRGLQGKKVREGLAGSGQAYRGPFILHAQADRELALRDIAHKSETITPCCHTHTHTIQPSMD